MTKKILVIGSSNTDIIIQVPYIPKTGETLIGHKYMIANGGKGANQAIAAKRSNGNVEFIACIGSDIFGKNALEAYNKDNLSTNNIHIIPNEASGLAQITVDNQGQNVIVVAPGANMLLTPEIINNAAQSIINTDILLLQLEIPLESVYRAIDIAYEYKKIIILNPAPAQKIDPVYLAKLDFITPNETEAEILTGIAVTDTHSAKTAADKLLNYGVKNVIITLGKHGVYLANSNISELIPGYIVNSVDSTAAGDTFNGCFASAFARCNVLLEAIDFGQKAAAISVTKFGAQSSMPIYDEIISTQLMLHHHEDFVQKDESILVTEVEAQPLISEYNENIAAKLV